MNVSASCLRFLPSNRNANARDAARSSGSAGVSFSLSGMSPPYRDGPERSKNEFCRHGVEGALILNRMCNLYSLTKGQAAIRDWFRARHDRTGNLPLFPGIFPDQMLPIVRNGPDGERELVMARWGMPGPPQFGGAPIT